MVSNKQPDAGHLPAEQLVLFEGIIGISLDINHYAGNFGTDDLGIWPSRFRNGVRV